MKSVLYTLAVLAILLGIYLTLTTSTLGVFIAAYCTTAFILSAVIIVWTISAPKKLDALWLTHEHLAIWAVIVCTCFIILFIIAMTFNKNLPLAGDFFIIQF